MELQKVGISSLTGSNTREQNDLVYRAMQKILKAKDMFINPKAPDAIDEAWTDASEITRWIGVLSSIHGSMDIIPTIHRR